MRAFFYFIFRNGQGRMNWMLRMHSVPNILIPDLWIKKRDLNRDIGGEHFPLPRLRHPKKARAG